MTDYKISFFDNVKDIVPKERKLKFEEILKYFNEVGTKPFSKKENLEAMICGSFSIAKRASEYLVSRSIITYDIDNFKGNFDELLSLVRECFKNNTYIYYTTASSTYNKPRIRLMLFIDGDIKATDYGKITRNIAYESLPDNLKNAIDDSSYSSMQLMFLPCKVNNDFRAGKNVGDLINVNSYLAEKEEVAGEENLEALSKELVTYHKNQPLDITREKVEEVLAAYDCSKTSYHSWFTVCQALNHQFRGSNEGLEIFTRWSLSDNRYKTEDIIDECRVKYYSVKGNVANPVTFGSIIKLVNEIKKLPGEVTDNPLIRTKVDIDKFKDYKSKFTAKGIEIRTILTTYQNFEALCKYYGVEISYDIITKRNQSTMFKFEDDNLLTTEIKSLMIRNGLNSQMASEYVYMMGRKNRFNSFKKILDETIWDGVSRFDEFCKTVIVNPMYEDIKKLYLMKWIQQMLYLSHVENEDRKIGRYILVFQGMQERGKSTWVINLLPRNLKSYVTEGLTLHVHESMNVLTCISNLIVELGELGQSFRKSDNEAFKAFFGRTKDVLNIKWIPYPVTFHRTTSFIGSINDEEFLKDRTGSTRFLIIPAKGFNGYHNIDMLQLYKEIRETTDYVNFELNEDEKVIQKQHNIDFEVPDVIEEDFLDNYDLTASKEECQYFSANEVLVQLGYRKVDITHGRRMDIGRILKKYDCHKNTKTNKWLLKLKTQE